MFEIIKSDLIEIELNQFKDFFQGKSVLVTGCTGLVGTYISTALAWSKEQGFGPNSITVTSKSGHYLFKDPILDLLSIIPGDITDSKFIKSLPMCDVVIHAAGYGQPEKFLGNTLATLRINSTATIELTGRVKAGGKFLFLSSSEVYSGLTSSPYKESQIGSTNTNHIRAAYIEGKRVGEAIVSSASKQLNFSGYSARLALAFGPGTGPDDSRVLNEIIRAALTTGKINLRDSGNAMRTYCYVADAVFMLFKIIELGKPGIYNVGGTSRTSILELANLVAKLTGATLEISPLKKSVDGSPSEVWVDISKMLSLIPEFQFKNFEDGLRNTIQWQTQIHNI